MLVQKGVAFQLWLSWVSILCQISRSYPNILIGSTCFTRFSGLGWIWAQPSRSGSGIWAAFECEPPKTSSWNGRKKTSWKAATSMPPVAEKMFRTLGSYAIIKKHTTYVCVSLLPGLRIFVVHFNSSLTFDERAKPGMFGKGKALSQPTGECPQRSAGRWVEGCGWIAARGLPPGDSPYEKAKVWAFGDMGSDGFGEPGGSLLGLKNALMAMAKKIRIYRSCDPILRL